ncbi:MAG: pyridoxamine 5'-phosphate oxidase family protein [Clostridiales bacterium]|nr:pyridoxamine 5'-phosphate oxidase family protein [Clostridiales bacterium]
MFREMRRFKQLLSKEETIEILNKCSSGVLGVNGDDGYPYTVPLSYVFRDGKLYFHCAKEGHKIDSIKRNDKVTFCVIEKDNVIQESFETQYRSVTIFGRARILTDDSEKRNALRYFVEKYSPNYIEKGHNVIENGLSRVCVIEVKIEHMTGKAAKQFVDSKK